MRQCRGGTGWPVGQGMLHSHPPPAAPGPVTMTCPSLPLKRSLPTTLNSTCLALPCRHRPLPQKRPRTVYPPTRRPCTRTPLLSLCRGCPQDNYDRDPAHHESPRHDHRRPTHHAAGGLHDVQGGGGARLPASGLLVMFGTEAWQQQHMQPGRIGAADRQVAELAALLAASLLCVDLLPASPFSPPTHTYAH